LLGIYTRPAGWLPECCGDPVRATTTPSPIGWSRGHHLWGFRSVGESRQGRPPCTTKTTTTTSGVVVSGRDLPCSACMQLLRQRPPRRDRRQRMPSRVVDLLRRPAPTTSYATEYVLGTRDVNANPSIGRPGTVGLAHGDNTTCCVPVSCRPG
jgi:hypothetical protein